MSDTIKDDNPEWPLNRFGHHSNGFQLNYHKYYRRMRYAGYRATIYFLYGKLGKRKRIQVPSCVGEKILRFVFDKLYANTKLHRAETEGTVSKPAWCSLCWIS